MVVGHLLLVTLRWRSIVVSSLIANVIRTAYANQSSSESSQSALNSGARRAFVETVAAVAIRVAVIVVCSVESFRLNSALITTA